MVGTAAASTGSGNRDQTAAVAVKAAIDDIVDDDTIIADRRFINGNMLSLVLVLVLISLRHSPDAEVDIDRLLDEEKPPRRWVWGDTHVVVVFKEKTRDEVQIR